jgi:hypothetical protein
MGTTRHLAPISSIARSPANPAFRTGVEEGGTGLPTGSSVRLL